MVLGQQPRQHRGGVGHHGAELPAAEQLAVAADALVGEEHLAARLGDLPGDHRHQRGRGDQQQETHEQVEAALERLRPGSRQVVVDPERDEILAEEMGDAGAVDRQAAQGGHEVDVAVAQREVLDEGLAARHLVELEGDDDVRPAEPAGQALGLGVDRLHRHAAPGDLEARRAVGPARGIDEGDDLVAQVVGEAEIVVVGEGERAPRARCGRCRPPRSACRQAPSLADSCLAAARTSGTAALTPTQLVTTQTREKLTFSR